MGEVGGPVPPPPGGGEAGVEGVPGRAGALEAGGEGGGECSGRTEPELG